MKLDPTGPQPTNPISQPEEWKPEDIEVLLHVFSTPTTVKSQFSRENIYEICRLLEHGFLTTYDPREKQYGTVLYATPQAAYLVWTMQGTVPTS